MHVRDESLVPSRGRRAGRPLTPTPPHHTPSPSPSARSPPERVAAIPPGRNSTSGSRGGQRSMDIIVRPIPAVCARP